MMSQSLSLVITLYIYEDFARKRYFLEMKPSPVENQYITTVLKIVRFKRIAKAETKTDRQKSVLD